MEPYGSPHVVLILKPVRRLRKTVGIHRRWAWFAVGNAAMDRLRKIVNGQRLR